VVLWEKIADIYNCDATGKVSGKNYVGGFVGGMKKGTIEKCYSTGDVYYNVPLTGYNSDDTGGFAGQIFDGNIKNSFANGDVFGAGASGGFAGYISNTKIENCYGAGIVSVEEGSKTTGFAGFTVNASSVQYCYSLGDVSGPFSVSGFNTVAFSGSSLINCVSGSSRVTGERDYTNRLFVNVDSDVIKSNNYANKNMIVNNTVTSDSELNGIGKDISVLNSASFYTNNSNWNSSAWDLQSSQSSDKIWNIWDGKSFPYFQWQSAPAYVNSFNASSIKGSYRTNDGQSTQKVEILVNGVLRGNAGLSSGAWTYSFSPAISTDDVVKILVYEQDKAVSYPVYVSLQRPAGIEDFYGNSEKLTVYPNPVVDGVLNLKGIKANTGEKVRIYNVLGYLAGEYNISEVIRVDNLPQGIYILKVGEQQVKFNKK